MKPFTRIWLVVLTMLVVASLTLNAYFFLIITNLRRGLQDLITNVRVGLATVGREPFTVQVYVDEEIPFVTTVPINETLTWPLDINYPLSTVINTYVNVPLLGRQDIAIPIDTVIPIRYTLEVPVQTEVPISLTYHLQTTVPVEIALPPEIELTLDEILQQAEEGLQ